MTKVKLPTVEELEQVKRSFYTSGNHTRTTLALEPIYWEILDAQARACRMPWPKFITQLHGCMPDDCKNFSVFVRIYLLKHELAANA